MSPPGSGQPTLPGRGRRWLLASAAGALLLVLSFTIPDRWLRTAPPPATQPTNAAAHDRYRRARQLIDRQTLEDGRRAAELLEEAVTLDPSSAPAQGALADAYLVVAWLGETREPALSRARQAALRAIQLDPDEADARATLGTILAQFDWDSAAGERELKRALERGPDRPLVLRFYSDFLWQEGRFEEALALNERELALDPASRFANRDRAIILYYARRYEESAAQSRKTLELDRYFRAAYHWLGKALEQLGREQEAAEAFVTPLTFVEETQAEAIALRAAAAQGGMRAYWKAWLLWSDSQPPSHDDRRAIAAVRMGDHERAFALLEGLFEQRSPWLRSLAVEPQWDPLRADPRFQSLLRRVDEPQGASTPQAAAPLPAGG